MMAADFFAGLGGFTAGAASAGCTVALAVNHDPIAVDWHRRNHPEVEHEVQDLQQFDMRRLPDLTDGVLVASPACQGHSSNSQPARRDETGQRRAFLQRSTAWAVVTAAEEARPRFVVVENVRQFLRWELYGSWRGALETLGYRVTEQVVDAASFGVPQRRLRAVIVASMRDRVRPLWESARSTAVIASIIETDAVHAWLPIKGFTARDRMRRAQQLSGRACLWNNVSESRGRPLDGHAPTVTTKSAGQLYLLDGDHARLLTLRELARLQGFPDSYRLPTQRTLAGRLIGNAIPPPMAEAVCRRITEDVCG